MGYTEKTMLELLRSRYSLPEWVLLDHVPIDGRIADAMAFSTYRSNGHELHGFEVKVSRADWLSELRDMSKAEACAKYCDKWWIVAPSKDGNGKPIVDPAEMPTKWGLITTHGSGLRVKKQAVSLRRHDEDIDRELVTALLRTAMNRQNMHEALAEARREGYVEGSKVHERREAQIESQLKRENEQTESVKAVLHKLGLSLLYSDDGKRIKQRIMRKIKIADAVAGISLDRHRYLLTQASALKDTLDDLGTGFLSITETLALLQEDIDATVRASEEDS